MKDCDCGADYSKALACAKSGWETVRAAEATFRRGEIGKTAPGLSAACVRATQASRQAIEGRRARSMSEVWDKVEIA